MSQPDTAAPRREGAGDEKPMDYRHPLEMYHARREDAAGERDSKELNSIAASLNLEYDDVAIGWWLPAEPGPILCASVADAVREALRLADNDCRRATAALSTAEREREALREALANIVVKCIPSGTQDCDFVLLYKIPTGPIHRAIPLLQEMGITVRPGFDGRARVPSGGEEGR